MAAAYKKTPPRVSELIAQDASPSKEILKVIKALSRRWVKRFNDAAPLIADAYVNAMGDATDKAFKQSLKDAGFAVEFKVTRPMQDALNASIAENVGLIRSIPEQYLTQVEGIVMRSYTAGRDLETMTKELRARYPITKRRAELIARDQSNKLNATVTRTRRLELGLTKAVWIHSGGGKEPRQSHVKFSGKEFDIEKGAYIDGEHIQPGELINCFPPKSIVSSLTGCKKLWRNWYAGKLTKIITESGKFIEATPNHPILTQRGWVAIKDVNLLDDVIEIGNHVVNGFTANVQSNNVLFSEVFDSISNYIRPISASGTGFEFHGDITDKKIDTINIDGFLPREINSVTCEKFLKFFFSDSYHFFVGVDFDADSSFYSSCLALFGSSKCDIGRFCSFLSLLKSLQTSGDDICGRLSSYINLCINKTISDCTSGNAIFLRKLNLANSRKIIGNDFIIGEFFAILSKSCEIGCVNIPSADLGENFHPINPQDFARFKKTVSLINKTEKVVDIVISDFSGHVYNLESLKGWYDINTYIVHNCRCVSKTVLPF